MTYDQILLGEFEKNYKGGTILFPDVTRCPHVFIGVYQKLIAQGSTDSEIKELVTIFYPNYSVYFYMLKKMQVKYGIDLSGFNNKYSEFLKEEFDVKFDFIICNPPYDGKTQLHQQFYNHSLELLKKDGIQVFVQPATPVQNKKDWAWREHERLMIQNLKDNKVSVKICGWDIFGGNADGATNLMISTTVKQPSNSVIDRLEYLSGEIYENIPIEGINRAEMDPFIFVSLRQKLLTERSLQDVVFYTNYAKDVPEDMNGAYIQAIRGDITRGKQGNSSLLPTFFTIVSKDNSYHAPYDPKTAKGQCVQIPREQFENFYSYAKSFVARTGIMISKYNQHNESGELKTVPLPDFSVNRTPQEWDEFMRKELEITDEEWKEIRRVLPDYHDLGEY